MASILGALAPRKRRVSIIDETVVPNVVLRLDASVQEVHGRSAQVTRHPIEAGSQIADHINPDPQTIEITGIVSNDPIVFLPSLNRKPSVTGGDPGSRAEDALDFFETLIDERRLVTVATTLKIYENMALENLSSTRNKDTGRTLSFVARFSEITIATTEQVAAPDTTPERRARTNRGVRNGGPAGGETSTQARNSVLFELL